MPSMRSESQTTHSTPSALKALFLASRPRTWIASISPVLIGCTLAYKAGTFSPLFFTLTLLFSILIQIGTNYANDYFDFIKGADTADRIGPKRATEQGWIAPKTVLFAALTTFFLALLIATPLMIRAGWWSFPLAAFCILFGMLYTGGPKPLGYIGLGELLVFIFFGPVAAIGSYFLQTGASSPSIFLASLAPGFLSCSILIANNLRDHKTDFQAGKITLIVRFGRAFGSWEYLLSIAFAAFVPVSLVLFLKFHPALLLSTLILPASFPLLKKAFTFNDPRELISLLKGSAFLLILYTIFFCGSLLLT